MPSNLVYKLTDRGRAEMSAKASRLSATVRALLNTVGEGASFEEIWTTVPQVVEGKLRDVLQKLVARGMLEAVYSDLTASDLDITRFFNRAVVEPTMMQKREAERATIRGMRTLQQAGYFVKIVNRSAKRIPPHSGDKHSVLVVDPDENNTMLVARALLVAGFDTRTAARRQDIIAELNTPPPVDAIAMDVALPDVIGLELLGRLRAHPVYRDVPVIVMTSKVEHDDIVAALAYGASGYLTKPFKPETLLESVKAVLGLA
ncbi:MAG: response regulator [Burkholderiales bacterium]|nr:response regulator [Burkholderiales bacterium]